MKRILVVSDAVYPLATSGFAVAVRPVIDGLLDRGFKVLHMARGTAFNKDDMPAEWKNKPITVAACPPDDLNGYRYLGYLLDTEDKFEPIDAIVYVADPESIRSWRTNVQARSINLNRPMPTVTYGPTEGGPLLRPNSTCLTEIVATGGIVSTYTEFSANVMTDAIRMAMAPGEECPYFDIRIIPHGVDHAPFRKLDDDARQRIRKAFGWENKIVVTNVARNAGRKMWVSLFKAIKLLEKDYPNLILYAHTAGFEGYAYGGHNLLEIARNIGITDRVIHPDRIPNAWHGVPYEQMIAVYNASDMFVSPSGAEGWNLPVNEAAACGCPVICTAYSGMWEQAKEYATPLEPENWFTVQDGTELAIVSPGQIAEKIDEQIQHPAGLVERGLEIAKTRTWQPLRDGIVRMVEEVLL